FCHVRSQSATEASSSFGWYRRSVAAGILSPLRQFQLDAPVVAEGFVAVAGVDRLELAKTGGDQALRRYAFADQILHHRDGARRRQFPVRLERRGRAELPRVGMAVDAQHPVDLRRNLLFQVEQGARELVELG